MDNNFNIVIIKHLNLKWGSSWLDTEHIFQKSLRESGYSCEFNNDSLSLPELNDR